MAQKKKEEDINPEGLNLLPLMDRPESVAIVALGLSSSAFLMESMTNKSMQTPYDEVWTVNRGLAGVRHDKVFLMDDLKWLEKDHSDYAKYVQKSKAPIFVSTPYPEYPNAVPYPLHEVLEYIGDDIFTQNTVSYMIAYAMYIGCQTIGIYGADFVYPTGNTSERGGMAVAYLLGVCRERKIHYRLPNNSTMLYANSVKMVGGEPKREYYGYHRKWKMDEEAKHKEARKETVREVLKAVKAEEKDGS